MNEFGSYSRELLDNAYRLNGMFSCYRITGNDISKVMWNRLELLDVLFENNNMQNISMQDCNYQRTDFISSDLRGGDLSSSSLSNVVFRQCSMIKLNLSNSSLYECAVKQSSAESLDLSNSRIVKTGFYGSELFRLNCGNSVIINSEFSVDRDNCMWGLAEAKFTNSIIINTVFRGVDYSSEMFEESLFINCRFEN